MNNQKLQININSNNGTEKIEILSQINIVLNKIFETVLKYDSKYNYFKHRKRIVEDITRINNRQSITGYLADENIDSLNGWSMGELVQLYNYLFDTILPMEGYIHRQHITATILKMKPEDQAKLIEVTIKRYKNILDIESYDISPVANCITRILFPVNDRDIPKDLYPFPTFSAFSDFENYDNETVLKQVKDYIDDPEELYPIED